MCLSRVQKKATQSIIPGRAPAHLIACLVQCHWSGLGGDSPKGGPAWGHLRQWLPVSSARERLMPAASLDRLSNSHLEAPSAPTQKSRARLVLQDVLHFLCTRNMLIVDKKKLKKHRVINEW